MLVSTLDTPNHRECGHTVLPSPIEQVSHRAMSRVANFVSANKEKLFFAIAAVAAAAIAPGTYGIGFALGALGGTLFSLSDFDIGNEVCRIPEQGYTLVGLTTLAMQHICQAIAKLPYYINTSGFTALAMGPVAAWGGMVAAGSLIELATTPKDPERQI